MKVLGFMTIHYGLEYLKESLLSIKDHVIPLSTEKQTSILELLISDVPT